MVKSTVKEIGFRDDAGDYYNIDLTDAGCLDPLFSGLEPSLPIFQLHGEMIEPVGDMELLATGRHCKSQVMRVGSNSYGFQGHHELSKEMLGLWLQEDDDLKKLDGNDVMNDFESIRDLYTANGKKIFLNFLKIANMA